MPARRRRERQPSALRRWMRRPGSNSPDTAIPPPADRDQAKKDSSVRPSVIPDSLLSTLAEAIPPEQRPDEPVLASAPYFVEFAELDEFELDHAAGPMPDESLPVVDLACAIELPSSELSPEIDPARETELPPDELTPEPPFSVRRQAALVSFAAHLIVLLLVCNVLFLLTWPKPKMAAPIPVQLVLEEPLPEPLPQTEASKPPPAPPGRLSSEEIGDVTKPPPQAGAGAPVPNDAPTKAAAAAPPPPPPEPQPPKEALAAPASPKPKPPPPIPTPPKSTPAAARVVAPHPSETPHDAPRVARFVGANATRDEYLAQLLALTRQHINLLPRSLLANRE